LPTSTAIDTTQPQCIAAFTCPSCPQLLTTTDINPPTSQLTPWPMNPFDIAAPWLQPVMRAGGVAANGMGHIQAAGTQPQL
ncbi:hypothetical protein FRC11_013477, partial [Ceratobasidium sp. 423]